MRHLWDKIDDKCKRCGLERMIAYKGDGIGAGLKKWKYKFPEEVFWRLEVPECNSTAKVTYEKLFDYEQRKRR